jgi:hypothetical protein
MRFPLGWARVRAAGTEAGGLGAHPGTDWADGGLGADDAVAFAAALEAPASTTSACRAAARSQCSCSGRASGAHTSVKAAAEDRRAPST